MIYIIGGPSRSGKSTLAHMLAKRLRCPEISVDWLRSVILPYLDGKEKMVLERILFAKEGDEPGLDEAEVLWPAMKSFIEDKARWPGDFVLDGIHFLPKYLQQLDATKLSNIKIIFLVKTDETKILQGFDQVKIRKNDWLLKRHWQDKDYLRTIAKDIAVRGRYFEDEARKYGFRVVNTEDNFKDKLHQLTEQFYRSKKQSKATRAKNGEPPFG